ncbi:MAG: hypothetical protein QOJ29_5458 [Thermoleophilaceae bacterium]|jgi:hypothetical protein|nr:hypothetical protein [Solirubrobacteraceae bacterium]MEA2497547.1 hypothetical protein [Thermoleophilaceae bacterium]
MNRFVHTLSLPVALVALMLGVAGRGATAAEPQRAAGQPVALRVIEATTPRLAVPNYETRGSYPQVAGGHTSLTAVNAALTRALRSEQRRYARVARDEQREVSPVGGPGLFSTNLKRSVLSASSVVVSGLIPLTERFPGGNEGQTWLAVTVRVPSGARVSISDLFNDRARGLRALAAAVRTRLPAGNSCIRKSLKALPTMARGFAPTKVNYRYFALQTSGLVIGFPVSQVGFPPCSRVSTTVPYATLRAELSPLAKRLIAGVRQPRTG